MKIATFNVNGIRARLPRLIEWLERETPDVVCLQELKCADDSLPIADIEAALRGARPEARARRGRRTCRAETIAASARPNGKADARSTRELDT